ncbi:hypothetical protein Esti_006875 [Eimeria stiedai]
MSTMVSLVSPLVLATLLLTQTALLIISPSSLLSKAEEATAAQGLTSSSFLSAKPDPDCLYFCNALIDGLAKGTAACRLDTRRAANPQTFTQGITSLFFSTDSELSPPPECCNCGEKGNLVAMLASSSSSGRMVMHAGESVCVETPHPYFPALSCIIFSSSFSALFPSNDTSGGPPVVCSRFPTQPPPPPPPISSGRDVEAWLDHLVSNYKVILFTKSYCPFCEIAVHTLEALSSGVCTAEIDRSLFVAEIQDALHLRTGGRTVPRVFIGGSFVGGCEEVLRLEEEGKLHALLKMADTMI